MIRFFLSFAAQGWKRYFQTRAVAKIITIFLFLVIVVGIAIAVFFGVRSGFTLMKSQAYGSETLPLYTYEVFFLVLGYLMFVSAIISSLFVLLSGDKNNWIAASPKFKTMLVQAGLGIFESAIWTLLVIGIPAIIALAQVYGGGWVSIPSALIGLILLTMVTSGLAMILILLLATVFYRVRSTTWRALRMKWLAIASALFVAALTYALWRTIVSMDVLSLFISGSVTATVGNINGIVAAFHWFPTNIIALMMLALQNHSWSLAWIYIGWLAVAAVAVTVVIYLFSFDYLRVWQRMQEGSFEARTSLRAAHEPPRAFPRFFKSDLGAIFEKEIIVNFRSLKDSLWVVFILGLWILQTALNLFLRRNSAEYGASEATIIASIQALQVATTVFFTSTFTLRFALPSFSSDRRMAWIMGTAPIAPRRIFFSKLVFYTIVFLLLGIALGIANASILGISLVQEGAFLTLLAVMIIAIATFGLSLGALFPDTESDDPERVSTSLPGLGFTFISLAYGGLGTWLYYIFLSASQSVGLDWFILFSIFLIILMVSVSSMQLKTFNPFSEEMRTT